MNDLNKYLEINVVQVSDLFVFFRRYVDQVIGEWSKDNDVRPKSYDEWYNYEYLLNLDKYSQQIFVELEKPDDTSQVPVLSLSVFEDLLKQYPAKNPNRIQAACRIPLPLNDEEKHRECGVFERAASCVAAVFDMGKRVSEMFVIKPKVYWNNTRIA